ncbi:MAG TPA: DUF433 domain-containing protein [Verrucomicrobiae bacterium]|nr:DUF433 domain-containing protein [Verrucomicrobiae bacterium]
MNSDLVTVDPEIMSGEPVFKGARVPVRNLVDYLSGGHSLEDFLEGFPGVARSQTVAFLEEASAAFLDQLSPPQKTA